MTPRQQLRRVSLSLLTAILLLAAVQSRSQTAAPAGKAPGKDDVSSVMLIVDRDGFARVHLWLTAKLDDPTKMRQALTQSLNFPVTFEEKAENVSEDDDAASLDDVAGGTPWTFVRGRSARSLFSRGTKSTTRMDFQPLMGQLRSVGIKRLSIGLMFEDPDAEVALAGGAQAGPTTGLLSRNFYHAEINLDAPTTSGIEFSFGYSLTDILRRSVPLFVFILLTSILTLWMRRSALRKQKDTAEMWGHYFHFWQLLTSLIWLIWIPICASTGLSEVVSFVVGHDRTVMVRIFNISIYLLPPLFVLCLCHVLSKPVYDRVRGVEWLPRDVMRRAIATNAISLLPLFIILIVIGMHNGGSRFTGLFLIGAGAVWLLSLGFVNRLFRASVQAVSSGELRDRIFELAHKAGVPVKQIYVLPDSTSQLSNALASSSNAVMITASLLKHLSKREVDSIMAHELGHLKEKHPQVRGYITLGAIFVTNIVAWAMSSLINLPRSGPVIFSLALLTSILIMHFVSRSNERHADAIAISLTGDPESFISGLAKLCRLNLMPLNSGSWGQSLESHPRSLKRLQDIARTHGISEQRFQELLDAPFTAEGGYSTLNAEDAPGRAFSSDYKRKRLSQVVLAMLAMLLLLPVAVSLLLAQMPLQGWSKWAAYAGGAVITFGLYLIEKNFVTTRGYRRPAQAVRHKLEQQGFGDAGREGVFVGLGPAAQTQKYENCLFWDAGVLWLTADKLYYIGEETRFGLERGHIAKIYWHNSRAEWLADRSLVVEWRGNDGGANNAVYFLRLDGGSVLQERRELESLYGRMNDWLERSQPFPEASPQLQSLPSPSFKAITSEPVNDKFNPRLLFKSWLMLSGVSALLSFAFGLSLAGACYSMAVLFFVMLVDEFPKILSPTPASKSVNMDPMPKNASAYTHGAWAKSNPAPTAQSVE